MSSSSPSSENQPANFSLFLDRRIISIFVLGAISGLPWVMIGSALTLWLKEAGISRTEIGYAGLITVVYAINCFWAPILDVLMPKTPFRMGARRSWILWCQIVIAAACVAMSGFSAESAAHTVVLIGLIIAFTSATQDIAIDAYRVDQFARTETAAISAAASAATAGWWTGYAGLGFIPLALSDMGWTWPQLYILLGAMTLCCSTILFFSPDPPQTHFTQVKDLLNKNRQYAAQLRLTERLKLAFLFAIPFTLGAWAVFGSQGLPEAIKNASYYVPLTVVVEISLLISLIVYLNHLKSVTLGRSDPPAAQLVSLPAWLFTTVHAPLADFFQRNGVKLAWTLLCFVVVFKLGESFLGRMSILFYKEVGFTNTQIASYSKILTWVVTVGAALPCGILNAKLGIVRGLFISGIFMAASNLLFIVLAVVGPDTNWYLATVIVDGITAAWASVAFVSFISMLCSHTFSASQYALLASLGALGRTTISAFSGQLVDSLNGNWVVFLSITTAMVIPGLVMLVFIRNRLVPDSSKAE